MTNGKKTTPILQAYANTKYFGKVDLKFDSNGVLVSIDGTPIIMDNKIMEGEYLPTIISVKFVKYNKII